MLPEQPEITWRVSLSSRSPGGIAATNDVVIVSDREAGDTLDCFRCLDAHTGKELWSLRYPALGKLDYGNSPRATPLIFDRHVVLFGAFGDLHCVKLEDGAIEWSKNLRKEFLATDKLVWGTTSSPLLVDGKLLVNPGGNDASLVALDPYNGDVIWKTSGRPSAFASFVVAEPHGRRQIIGYDKTTLGGWDIQSGTRLWELKPQYGDDFNVPTPIVLSDRLLLSTENNGTRLYEFDEDGRLIARPFAVNEDLAPDTHTPVVAGNRLFGVWQGLYCLNLEKGLKTEWSSDENCFFDYCTLVASQDRVLVLTLDGTLLLFDALANEPRVLSRCRLFAKEGGCYSHPALVGQRIYVRGSAEILAVELAGRGHSVRE